MTQVQAGTSSTWNPTQDGKKIFTVSRGHSLLMGEAGATGLAGAAAVGAALAVGAAGAAAGDAGVAGVSTCWPVVFSPTWVTAHAGKLGGKLPLVAGVAVVVVVTVVVVLVVVVAGLFASSTMGARAASSACAAVEKNSVAKMMER